MPSRSGRRRQLARLRAEFFNRPLALDARVLGDIQRAISLEDASGAYSLISASMGAGEEIPSQTKIVNGVAIIPVTGVLRDEVDWMVRYFGCSCYEILERDISAALDNQSVSAVVLWMNTPGGAAIGAKRTADGIFARRGAKPIVAYCQTICGSAGYYLAAACDRIEATADAMIGSIGTIYTHMEVAKLAKDFGYGVTVFTNEQSPKKGHGNQWEPLTADSKKTLQEFVDSYGTKFVSDVARYRNVSSQTVVEKYGQGDAFVGTEAVKRGMAETVVANFAETLNKLATHEVKQQVRVTTTESETTEDPETTPPPESRTAGSSIFPREVRNVNRLKAQLYAMGLIGDLNASDETCRGILAAWFAAKGTAVPADDAETLKALQGITSPAASWNHLQQVHDREQAEARAESRKQQAASLDDLRAAAKLVNTAAGKDVISADMVFDAFTAGLDVRAATAQWNESLTEKAPEKPLNTTRVTMEGEGHQRWANDVVDAMLYRATSQSGRHHRSGQESRGGVRAPQLSNGAANFVNMPLWAVAAECLRLQGRTVDQYGDRELICRDAMEVAANSSRHTFFSAHEGRQFVQASGVPYARPGDFPNILSSLANKFLDSIELDEWTYPEFTAVWPTGFGDFKPATMVNHGTPDELDEILDSGDFNNLQKAEEVLSYIFCRRFGNKWGWTPILLANDDLGAFAEGMIGLDEAWETTQHRLCLSLIMSNPTLLDGSALFASRTQGNNDRTSGGAPSDSEWASMEGLYADIKGVGSTTRRVRGSLNTILVPTGTQHQEARRTFMPLNAGGLDPKAAATTANVGIYRGLISIVPEAELRDDTVATRFYGMRSPTQLRTATVVRGYFNGFGQAGRRERWYDPATKTTWISIEGRIGVAIKNWRYIIRNKGAA